MILAQPICLLLLAMALVIAGELPVFKGLCTPTISCTLLGGYCFTGRLPDCDGTVDRRGCIGRKCKCCIPDHTTPDPPTCPACICTPSPTTEGTTSSTPGTRATTTATAKTPPTIESRCSAIDGFLWSSQCFKLLIEKLATWDDAREDCQAEGLELAEIPDEDAVSFRTFLLENKGDNVYFIWLGARVSGSQMRWERSGEEIMSSNALWWQPNVCSSCSDRCLRLMVHDGAMQQPTRPYDAYRCSSYQIALCQLVMD